LAVRIIVFSFYIRVIRKQDARKAGISTGEIGVVKGAGNETVSAFRAVWPTPVRGNIGV
jgi:hypothetical protein